MINNSEEGSSHQRGYPNAQNVVLVPIVAQTNPQSFSYNSHDSNMSHQNSDQNFSTDKDFLDHSRNGQSPPVVPIVEESTPLHGMRSRSFSQFNHYHGGRASTSQPLLPTDQALMTEHADTSHFHRFMKFFFSTNLLHHTHGKSPEELNKFQKFQKWLAEHLESHWAQVFIIFLLLLDVVITSVEILIEEQKEKGHEKPSTKVIHRVLYGLTLTILGIFVIEIFLKIIAFGWRFFTKFLFVFDAAIVITSLVLEIVYGVSEDIVVGLLLLLRFWRVIRIVYGVAYTSQVRHEERMAHMTEHYESIIQQKDASIAQLYSMIKAHNDHISQVGMGLKDLEEELDWNNPTEREWKEKLLKIHVQLF